MQLLKDEMWTRKSTNKIKVFEERKRADESDILKKIRKNNTREKEIVQAMKREDGLAWKEDDVVYMEGRIYVPNNKDLKEEILREHHDLADVRHLG